MNEVSPHKAPTLVGIVYYADDPDKKVFRIIYPEFDDRELDQPPHDGNRQIMHDEHGKPHGWHTFGVDPNRTAVFEKVPVGDPRAVLTGTP